MAGDELFELQRKYDEAVERLDELRRGNPRLFMRIEMRYIQQYGYTGFPITTRELLEFANEHHLSLATGGPIK